MQRKPQLIVGSGSSMHKTAAQVGSRPRLLSNQQSRQRNGRRRLVPFAVHSVASGSVRARLLSTRRRFPGAGWKVRFASVPISVREQVCCRRNRHRCYGSGRRMEGCRLLHQIAACLGYRQCRALRSTGCGPAFLSVGGNLESV